MIDGITPQELNIPKLLKMIKDYPETQIKYSIKQESKDAVSLMVTIKEVKQSSMDTFKV